MLTKSTCVLAIALALFCSPAAQAVVVDSPIKNFIDQAVNDAMQKILSGIGSIPNQVVSNVNQVQEAVGNIAQPIVATTGTVAAQLVNDYKNMGSTVLNAFGNLKNQAIGSIANIGSTIGSAYDQLETVMNAYEAQYCTPAQYFPSVKKPAQFTGPSFELILSSGECSFDHEALIVANQKQLDCLEPSITLIKNPANFTSKYHSAAEFVSKECLVKKTFGEEIEKVLFVFDGSHPVDINTITSTVLNEIRQVTGAIGGAHQALAGQLTSFIGSIPSLGSGIKLPGINLF